MKTRNAIAFDLPLRLPGQYFDKETNTHYNMARDYASETVGFPRFHGHFR